MLESDADSVPPQVRKQTELNRPTELNEPVLDIIVIGARAEEQAAIREELSAHSDEAETRLLIDKMKSYEGIPVHAVRANGSEREYISVGVLECSEMGNIAAAINSAYAICRYRPSLVIFSGIAGALDIKKIRVGDVMLPRSITTRDFQKLKASGDAYSSLSKSEKMEAFEVSNSKLSTFTRTVDVSERGRRLLSQIKLDVLEAELEKIQVPQHWARDYGIPMRSPSVVREEVSFSWSNVLSSEPYVNFLKDRIGAAWTSVEMESYGFLRAVEKVRAIYATDGIVVRSISDFATHKELTDKDPQWRSLALRNMAIATRFIIQEVFPIAY